MIKIKFETINKNKLKYLMLILVIVLAISTVFILKTSYSKYKYTKSYNLANGTVNYTLPDLNVVAMYQQASKGSTSYNEIDSAPTSGFELNTSRSYCGTYNANGGIDKDSSITLSYIDGGVLTKGLKKGTRCMLYFDYVTKRTSAQMLTALRNLNSSVPASSGARTDFSTAISSGSYTYEAADDLGVSYYFAGAVNTNWVKLGNSGSGYTYWRIVRINGDGSVRLIYSGTTAPTSSQATVMTSTGTQLDSKSEFNSGYDGNTYVGYMYGSTGQSSWANTHKNTNSSTIKKLVDTWYGNNKSKFESYIDTNVGFCGDRSASDSPTGTPGTSAGYPTDPFIGEEADTYYGAGIRKIPDLTCNKSSSTLYNNDLYTKTGASRGNKALSNPVGLITADEIALAGGASASNSGYYLYTGQNYWTMSPDWCGYESGPWLFYVDSNGKRNINTVRNAYGVRPVINLKSDLIWSGKGTWDSPFTPSL